MSMKVRNLKRTSQILVFAAMVSAAFAGDLTPPAGPVAPTMKKLSEVEPRIAINATNTPGDATHAFTISQSGSYYLTGNIDVSAGKSGIGVFGSNVTIDLNGFSVSGGVDGVNGVAPASFNSITIRNGTLKSGSGYGLALESLGRATVERVEVMGYGGVGIETSAQAHITDCLVRECNQGGIRTNYGAIVERCMVNYNGSGNAGIGIHVAVYAQVIDCMAIGNYGKGIYTADTCRVAGCSAFGSGVAGFDVGARTVVERCVASSNNVGFIGRQFCSFSRCAATSSNSNGFECPAGENRVSLIDCEARGNGTSTASAGIAVGGIGGRIENCQCTDNAFGIVITGTDNIVVKNSCRANASSNFSIAAGNETAPIVTNPGTNGFSSMTPWSNIAY